MYNSYIYKEHVRQCVKMARAGIPICVIDLETTGRSAKDSYVFQFAGLKCIIDKSLTPKIIESLCVFIKPEVPLNERITEITGFTNEDLKDKANEETVFPKIKKFMDNCIMCSHNTSFEESFMNAMYARNGCVFKPAEIIDTLKMSRDLHKEEKRHKLGVIAERYGIADGVKFHDARDDTIICGRLLSRFLSEYVDAKNDDQSKKITPKVHSVSYWEGKRHDQKRLYIFTNLGTVWFSVTDSIWGEKDKDVISMINMDSLIKQAFVLTGSDDLVELSKFKGSVKC